MRARAAILLLAVLVAGCGGARAAQAAPTTTVTLGFDDGVAQGRVGALLAASRLPATFYVNTASIGRPGVLSWADLRALARAGHEIGGHTRTHPDLTRLPAAAQRREICDDRAALVAHGLRPVSFAYPYGRQTATTRRLVRACGYASGRLASGLRGPPYALDPARVDRWAVKAAPAPVAGTTEAAVRAVVRAAVAHGGGWVPLVFHRICPGRCHRYSWPPERLARLLQWLRAEVDAGVLRVATTRAVLGVRRPAPGR